MSSISSPESNQSFLKSFNKGLRRRFTWGLFGIMVGVAAFQDVSSQSNQTQLQIEAPEILNEDDAASAMRADSVSYEFSLSLDCFVTAGKAKELNKMGLSRDTYLPLDLGIKQGGGLSDIFLVGQRAPGEKQGGRITDGWGLVYDSARQKYYVYSISTEDRLPDESTGADRKPIPYIIAKPLDVFDQNALSQGLTYLFGDMVLDIDHKAGNPAGEFHVSLSCQIPAR